MKIQKIPFNKSKEQYTGTAIVLDHSSGHECIVIAKDTAALVLVVNQLTDHAMFIDRKKLKQVSVTQIQDVSSKNKNRVQLPKSSRKGR